MCNVILGLAPLTGVYVCIYGSTVRQAMAGSAIAMYIDNRSSYNVPAGKRMYPIQKTNVRAAWAHAHVRNRAYNALSARMFKLPRQAATQLLYTTKHARPSMRQGMLYIYSQTRHVYNRGEIVWLRLATLPSPPAPSQSPMTMTMRKPL